MGPLKMTVCPGCGGMGEVASMHMHYPAIKCRGCDGWGMVPNFALTSMRRAYCPITEEEEFALTEKWFRKMCGEVA